MTSCPISNACVEWGRQKWIRPAWRSSDQGGLCVDTGGSSPHLPCRQEGSGLVSHRVDGLVWRLLYSRRSWPEWFLLQGRNRPCSVLRFQASRNCSSLPIGAVTVCPKLRDTWNSTALAQALKATRSGRRSQDRVKFMCLSMNGKRKYGLYTQWNVTQP